MVTEEMIEARYADSVIGAGVRKIYKTQQDMWLSIALNVLDC